MTQPGTRSTVVICSRQAASDSGGTVSMSLNTAPAELTAHTCSSQYQFQSRLFGPEATGGCMT